MLANHPPPLPQFGHHAGSGSPPTWFWFALAVMALFLVWFILVLLDGS